MARCDYWWYAGNVEWCDLRGDSCRCGGWQEACAMKLARQALQEADEETAIHIQRKHRSAKHAAEHLEAD